MQLYVISAGDSFGNQARSHLVSLYMTLALTMGYACSLYSAKQILDNTSQKFISDMVVRIHIVEQYITPIY
jgi:hypothetical protein